MSQELFDQGLRNRREVLGAAYVDESLRNADDFTLPMQELVTQQLPEPRDAHGAQTGPTK